MSYKQITLESYDEHAEWYDDKTREYLTRCLLADADFFIENLSGIAVLDLGCGPGRDMKYLQNQGLDVIGIDFSPKMIDICKKKGLDARLGDIETVEFADGSFDGVWACNSLSHMPKENLPASLARIKRFLRPNGIFFMGMKEGEMEGFMGGNFMKKFLSYYKDQEIRNHILPHFDILQSSRVCLIDNYLNYVCRKRD